MLPKFSIVIPTRNRAGLLKGAIRSVLQQSFRDFEVVVADNCCTDQTADVAASFTDPRLRYVRSPRPLSMVESWEFALKQARGSYVHILCDDDALSPRLLEMMARAIVEQPMELYTFEKALYYHNHWFEEAKRNTMTLPPISGKTEVRESGATLQRLFAEILPKFPAPRMLNAFCSRQLVERVRSKHGTFFHWTCPDLSAAVTVLNEVERYLHIDKALMLCGSARESGAAQSADDREPLKRFVKELNGRSPFEEVPLAVLTPHNMAADTLLRAKRRLGTKLDGIDLNWEWYFAACFLEVEHHRRQGSNVQEEKKEYAQTLRLHPVEFQQRVQTLIREHRPSFWKQMVQALADSYPGYLPLINKIHPLAEVASYAGTQHGFRDIAECAMKMDVLLSGLSAAPESLARAA